MISIRTVNLIWQKKQRGIYSPSPFSIIDDTGALALVTPRPLEPRAYDFTVHKPDGGVEIRWGYSAETLMKMEVSSSEDCIGMTSDDLYLFKNKSKSRFLTDKHINYIDAALSADGQRVAAAFSDLAGASFAVAYGDISGRLIWLQEFDSPISVVAISRDGTRVAAGLESGTLTLFDQERRGVWTFETDAPVRSAACSTDASRVAYGLEVGAVGLIDAGGARLWEADIGGSPVSMALSGDGGLCGVLAAQRGEFKGAVTIYCFLQDGSEGWQHDTERNSTGISLSRNGKFMAVGARDGTISFFGILPGDEGSGYTRSSDTVLEQANTMLASNEPAMACAILKTALAANAADLTLYDEYIKIKDSWRSSAIEAAKRALHEEDARSAIRALAALLEEDPLCTQAAEMLSEARVARSNELLDLADRQESAGNIEDAEQSLRESAAVAPMSMSEPRRTLAAFLARCADTTDVRANLLIQEGDIEGALNAFTAAQNRCPKPERANRIQGLITDVEFAAGMKAYDAKQYVQAVFQFKKVLRLNKNHAEAQRHLEFAKRFSQESTTDSLQDRFSRLE